MCVTLSLNDANIACYQAEMFPTEVRYTGAALGSNIAYVVFGGTASFVATALIDATGNGLMPAFYMWPSARWLALSCSSRPMITTAYPWTRSGSWLVDAGSCPFFRASSL